MSANYHTDFYSWVSEQAILLRSEHYDDLDWELIAHELQALRKNYEDELQSRITILLTDLLKWQYSPDLRCHSWRCGISMQRYYINDLIEDNPRLRGVIDNIYPEAYEKAVYEASLHTGIWFDEFEAHLWPFPIIMSKQFWPDRWPADETYEREPD